MVGSHRHRSRWQAWTELDRRVGQLALARAVNTMGLSLAMTFLGIYVVEGRGYPAWLFGVVAMFANLAQSLANAWAGDLSDRIGRRRVITGSLFVRSVFIAGLGTLVLVDASLWLISATMVITSALRGCFEPVAYALVSDVVREDQRIAAFGLQRMGTNLGWAIGPALGGVLTLAIPYGAVFYIAAAAMIAAGALTLRVREPASVAPHASGEPLARALADALRQPTLRLLMVGTLLSAVLATQLYATFSIYMTDGLGISKAALGGLYALNGAGVLMLQLPALALLRRFGIAAVLPWSSLLQAVGFALVGLAGGVAGGAVAIAVITSAEVLFAPAHQTAIAEVADPVHRGRTFGFVGFAQIAGVAVAPLVGGGLFDALGRAHHLAMWATIALFGVVQAACFRRLVRQVRAGSRAT